MAIVSDVEIRLRADIARLQQDMTAARRSVDNGMNGITRAADVAKKALATLGVGIGIKEFLSQVVGAQREFDKLNASLVTAVGSSAKAADAFKALQRFAATTPYSVAEATEAFIKLRNLGLAPSERALRSYGNTASSQGKSLNQFIEAVADAATGEFERLKEFGIKAKQNGDQVSLTFQGVTKNIGNNAKDIQAYLMRIGEVDFAGAMARRANTLDGVISNLGDSWNQFLLKVSSNGVGQGFASVLLGASNALSDFGLMLDATGGKAKSEGDKIQEAVGVHAVLKTVFETLTVLGTNVAYVFQAIGGDIGAFAAQVDTLFSGGMKGLLDGSTKKAIEEIGRARTEEAEQQRRAVDAKSAAILGAVAKNQAAQDAETANLKKNGADQLAQHEVQISAADKQASALNALADVRKKLLGIDPQDVADRKKIKDAYDTGAISLAEYTRLADLSNKQTLTGSAAYKQAQKDLDARAAGIERATQKQALLNQREQEHLAFLKATGQVTDDQAIGMAAAAQIKDLNDQIVAQQKLMDIAKSRVDSAAEQTKIAGEQANLRVKIDNAEKKRQEDLDALDFEREKQAIKNTADLVQGAQDQAKAEGERTRGLEDEIAALGLTSKEVANLTAARLRDQAVALDRKAEIAIIDEVAAAYRKQAAELRKQADLGLTKERVQEQKQFWSDVERTAHDTFISIADGGKDLATRLRDTLKNIFFDWLYQMTVKKWIINLQPTTAGGGGGLSALGNAYSSGGFGGMYEAGKTLLAGFGKNLSATFGGVIAKAGETFGSKAATSFGNNISSSPVAGGIASAIIAGMMANNNFYDQGWRLEGQANDMIKSQLASMFKGNGLAPITAVMTASMSSFEKILGKLGVNSKFASMLSGSAVFARAFGRKAPEITAQGIRGDITSSGFTGEAFADILEKGGWFRSDKRSTSTAALAADQQSAFDDTIRGMVSSVKGFADVLGLQASAVDGYSKQVKLTLTKDEEQNKKLIEDLFSGIGDDLAARVMPSLAQFTKEGETASTTLQRLAVDFQAVDAVLAMLSTNSQTALKAVGAASIEARERLVDLAGGLEALGTQTQYFYDNFLTSAEKIAPVQKQVNDVLGQFGLAGITTADQFKEVVQGMLASGALATEEGAKQYAALLAIAPKYKEVADYLAEAKRAADDLAAEVQQENQRQRDAASEYLDSTNAALQRAVEAQRDVVTKAYEQAMAGLETSIGSLNDSLEVTRGLSSALKGVLAGTSVAGSDTMARASAQQQIKSALAVARATGVLPDADAIRDALAAVGRDATDQFGTFADYVRSTAQTLNDVAQLGDITDAQTSIQERQLAALVAQKDQATATYNAEMARLDGVIALAQQQVDAIRGVDSSVLSVVAALAGLQGALALAANPPTTSVGGAVSGMSVEDAYRQVLGREGEAAGLAFWKQAFGAVVDSAELANFTKGAAPELAAKAGGTWAQFLAEHGAGATAGSASSTDSAAMLSELQTLNARMSNVERSTGQFAEQFDTASAGGNSILVEVTNG